MKSITVPIVAMSLVNQAFERVSDAIVRGEIRPGERIREALIAKDLGISRGVLREAMQRLEARKLVVRTPNIGVQVVALSRDDLEELYDVREALEGMAARLAALHMTKDELARLDDLVEAHGKSEAVRKGTDYYQSSGDEDFHVLIAQGSKNQRLIHTLGEEIYHQLRLYRYRSSVRPGRTHEALSEHRAVVAAIGSGDPEAAERAMRLHLTNARANRTWLEGFESVYAEAG